MIKKEKGEIKAIYYPKGDFEAVDQLIHYLADEK